MYIESINNETVNYLKIYSQQRVQKSLSEHMEMAFHVDYVKSDYKTQSNLVLELGHQTGIPSTLAEHMDMAHKVEKGIKPMNDKTINKEDIKTIIRKLKNKKAPGPDRIKPELIKALLNSDICIDEICRNLNLLMQEFEVPEGWKSSRTKLLPKKDKPTEKDLRPIALTNIIYKVFMSTLKDKIEKHIKINKQDKQTQSGFTPKRRIEDNILILKYCVEQSYVRKNH